MIKYISILILSFSLLGCDTPDRGGKASIFDHTKTTITAPDGGITIKENSVTTNVNQPDNPEDAATVTVRKTPDGETITTLSTGRSYNTTKIKAAIASLSPVIWAGVFLCVAGGLLLAFTKFTMLKSSLTLFGIGAAMITLAYLIPTYSMVFLLAIPVALILLGYLAWKAYTHKIALTEVVETTDIIKEKYMTPKQREKEFRSQTGAVKLTQRNSVTPKLVKQVKRK